MTTYDPPLSAYVPLASTSISSGTTNIRFTGLDAYDTYQIHLTGVASAAFNMCLRLNNDSSTAYYYQTLGGDSGTNSGFVNTARGNYCLGNFHQVYTLYMCQTAGEDITTFVEGYGDTTWPYFTGIHYPVAGTLSQIDLFPLANNITSGHVAIYGLGR
jgi:hypothetical protein